MSTHNQVMATVLTSWKEIANYLGKSVRTVQRWERTLRLPVRRLDAHNAWIVMAYATELDEWIHRETSTSSRSDDPEVLRLQRLCQELQLENSELLARCQQLEAMVLQQPVVEQLQPARLHRRVS